MNNTYAIHATGGTNVDFDAQRVAAPDYARANKVWRITGGFLMTAGSAMMGAGTMAKKVRPPSNGPVVSNASGYVTAVVGTDNILLGVGAVAWTAGVAMSAPEPVRRTFQNINNYMRGN